MTLHLDASTAAPLHRQVYDAIRSDILSGRLRPGDRLPATRALAEQLSLSRTTVAEAYDQLQAEGYVQGKHGSGTYVATNLPDDALDRSCDERDRAELAVPVPQLSSWGRRISAEAFAVLPASSEHFTYDLRPHRVAQDSFPWDAWRTAVDRALSGDRAQLLSYPPSAGHVGLREAVAAHVARYRGVSCSPDQIVIVNGSQQGLNLLAQLLLDAGERVAVEDPGYPAARLAFEARGLEVWRVPVDQDGMEVDRLWTVGPLRMIHVTPSHQDPTGATLSLGRRLMLLEVARQQRCLIVEDDYDSEFRYEGRPVESLQGLDHGGLVVYAGTFSKSVLAGLRIGFLVLPPRLVGPFVTAKSLWDIGAPMLEQVALAEFMRSGDFERHIRRMRRLYRLRRDALVAELEEAFGARVTVGERHGGLNVLVRLDFEVSDFVLAGEAAKAGIGLRPASPYYAHPPDRPTFLMGFAALPEEKIRDGVRKLTQVVGRV